MAKEDYFVDPRKISVIIPYSDLEKFVKLAHDMDVMRAQYSRLQEQYTAIQGMFSECLMEIKKIRDYVTD